MARLSGVTAAMLGGGIALTPHRDREWQGPAAWHGPPRDGHCTWANPMQFPRRPSSPWGGRRSLVSRDCGNQRGISQRRQARIFVAPTPVSCQRRPPKEKPNANKPPEEAAPIYPGPDEVDAGFLTELTNFLKMGGQYPWRMAEQITLDALRIVENEKTLQQITVPKGKHITIVGDLHGQFFDLLHILKTNGSPSASNPYLFNGDIVDRGSFSVECLILLLAWKVAFPKHVLIARGNHEVHEMNIPYGFAGEVLVKYGRDAYSMFQKVFHALPLVHVINNDVIVLHGGLPRNRKLVLKDMEEIERITAVRPGKCDTTVMDILWADPRDIVGFQESQRGEDIMTFGADVTSEFLKNNKLSLLIRSHEAKEKGFEWTHQAKCLTIFSAPNYCDQCQNDGAYVLLKAEDTMKVDVRVFEAVPRPPFYVSAMAYSPMTPLTQRHLQGHHMKELRLLFETKT